MPSPIPPPSVRSGTGVVFAAQVAAQLVSLGTLACLTRLISPAAFGVVGVALPLVMLPRMAATLGFSTAAIQDAQGSASLLSGLFWRNLWWSLVAAAVTAISGIVAAGLLGIEELTFVCPVLAVATLFNALSVIPLALLERQSHWRAASLIRLASQTGAAALAVLLAWRGGGVWSLIVQHSVELVLLALLVWPASPWRPSWRDAYLPRETQRFGGYYAVGIVVFYAAQNIDKLLLAAWLGSSPRAQGLLGMYSQAYALMMRPVYFVTTPLSSVMLPALSRAQDDAAARAHWTERFYMITALLLLPAGFGLWLVAGDVMQLLAPEWPEAGPLLRILAPLIVAQGFIILANNVLASLKRSDLLCAAAVVQLVLIAQGIWVGASFAGSDYDYHAEVFQLDEAHTHDVFGAAVGVTLVTLVAILLPYLVFTFSIAQVPLRRFFKALRLALPAAVAMAFCVHLVQLGLTNLACPTGIKLLLCIVSGVIVYGAITYNSWQSLRS